MTLKQIFKKTGTYNELAALMLSQKAAVNFYDRDCHCGERFTDYKGLAAYIRREYIKEAAAAILEAADYEIDGERVVSFVDRFGDVHTLTIVIEIVAAW